MILIAGVYWYQSASKHHGPKHPPGIARSNTAAHAPAGNAAEAARLVERYNAVVIGAGGESAWLKRPARPSDSGAAGARGEALALAPAVPAILADLKHQASQDRLEVDVRRAAAQSGAVPGVEVALVKSSQDICAWEIHQVPRLYRAAIVIDDLGQDMQRTRALLTLPYPLTFSILPYLPASRETSVAARLSGREVMLHLPMQPISDTVSPGRGAILVGMHAPEVARVIASDLEWVPNAAGVNNHMGSRATSDPALMAAVMKELSARRLYFIDSRTAPSTMALEAARQAGIPAFYRSVFLDDTETVDYTLAQLRSFRDVVERQGAALAIGHPHPTTIAALGTFLPELDRDDIELVPASQLVRLPEVARLSEQTASKARNR